MEAKKKWKFDVVLGEGEFFSRRTRRVLKNQEGSVVLIAMMLFMALVSTGLLSMRNATFEAAYVGSLRLSVSTEGVAEAGLIAALAKASQNPDAFIAFLDSQGPIPPYTVKMTDIFSPFFDTNQLGSFGVSIPGPGYVDWVTSLTEPIESNRMPGYSVGSFCFKKFRWETQSQFGPVTGTLPAIFISSEKVYSTYAYVGPITCSY